MLNRAEGQTIVWTDDGDRYYGQTIITWNGGEVFEVFSLCNCRIQVDVHILRGATSYSEAWHLARDKIVSGFEGLI